jgi:Amiloride-sensitive sodium channel
MEIMLDVGFGQRGNGGDNLFADGVQIAIQPSNQFPLPVTGFTAAPGQNTVASISKRTISRQNLPYNPETKGCSNDQRYTMESCQQLCSSHQLLNQLVAQGPTDLFTNVTLAQFKESVVEDQQSGFICPQQCSPSCFQEEYSVSTSLRSQTKDFRTQQCNANTWRNLCLQNATDPSQVCAYDPNQPGQCLPDPVEFAERVVSLTVYPSTLSVVNVNESPKYQAWSILSGIGGNLGLLLGFSLLTVFEWAEFFLFGTCCYRYYAKCLRSKPWSP